MKKFLVVFLIGVALAGCRTSYDIVMTNGTKMTGVSKPKFDAQRNFFWFKDANGQMHSIPAARVSVIEPTGSSQETKFGETKMRRLK